MDYLQPILKRSMNWYDTTDPRLIMMNAQDIDIINL